MILVFVVDTSPSMGEPLRSSASSDGSKANGMTKLDLAKMTVESLAKGLRKRISEHNGQFHQESPLIQQSLHNLGLGPCQSDQFLLLSTGRQDLHHPGAAACAAGGRLLIGYGDSVDFTVDHHSSDTPPIHGHYGRFERALKHLQATAYQSDTSFRDDGGGAAGLNASMNTAIHLMSRYRLNNRFTENFGLGRLPSSVMPAPGGASTANNALMPACLVLLTDGECLRRPPSEGGGSLQLQFGSGPLREFYQEPFRWDQRIFCLGIGGPGGISSSQFLPGDLKRLCEVTGGCHALLQSPSSLSQNVDFILRQIAPPRPKLPISYPLYVSGTTTQSEINPRISPGLFVNGGPICCFQSLEGGPNGEPSPTGRAMLLYASSEYPQTTDTIQTQPYSPPLWCIPESFFPSKKFDILPPRLAEPLLRFSGNYSLVGSSTFDPQKVMNLLQRFDHLILANRKMVSKNTQKHGSLILLHRDVYICEWVSEDGRSGSPPRSTRGMEYFPVCVQGAGRPLAEGDEHFLNIGILHVPPLVPPLSNPSSGARYSTLTLLPPDPHILLPLIIKAAEAEHRMLKKTLETKDTTAKRGGATAGLIPAGILSPGQVYLDEHWRSEFRAYLFRIPPYYQHALKRCLLPILPSSAHSMLAIDGNESLVSQCFSTACLQKIRSGEQAVRENNERLERQEAELRRRGSQQTPELVNKQPPAPVIGYGQYDPRDSTASYLAALRTMPAPWKARSTPRTKENEVLVAESTSQDGVSDTVSVVSSKGASSKSVIEVLGDLPNECLLAYYESRRRWVFGGTGLTTRGLHVEGAGEGVENTQYYDANHSVEDESLLALAGVGASTLNKTTTAKMGDFRERLLWSRAPIVGYGSNVASGVSATTGPDGAPKWSVDDDVMPMSFFDMRTGEFADSVQTRVSSRVLVNFGNPFKDKRGDAIVPENFLSQSPSFQSRRDDNSSDDGPHTPPGSPPHDAFSTEGEDEAVFAAAERPNRRKSPHHVPAAFAQENDVDKTFGEKRPRESDSKIGDMSTEVLEDPSTSSRKKPKVMPAPPPPKPLPSQSNMPRPRPPPPKPPPQKNHPPPPPRPPPRPEADKHPATKPPPVPASKPKPAQAPVARAEQPAATVNAITKELHLQSPDKKPQVNLPPGWMCAWSKSQKRWYFFDQKTNKSVWQWPPPGGTNR